MVESLRAKYTRLFDIHVLHHYWLDDGGTVFDALPAVVQTNRLLDYDVRKVLSIAPDASTAAAIAGLRGVFRTTGPGLTVAVPDDAVVPSEQEFVFFVVAVDSQYADYTALTLRSQRVVEVADPSDAELVHRYKENVPVLSNLTGTPRGTGSTKRLFLSQEYPTGVGDGVEALVLSGSKLRQLTGDPPNAPFQELGPKDAHPVYAHQGDVPAIMPPAVASGAPAAGIEMRADTPPAVIAVIRLRPRRVDDAAFSFTTATGKARTPTRVFEMHLRSRSTTRRYLDKRDGSIISTDPAALSLTHFGNAGTKQKPPLTAIGVERSATDPTKVASLVSNIHV
jgi:hypothetical protein